VLSWLTGGLEGRVLSWLTARYELALTSLTPQVNSFKNAFYLEVTEC